MDFADSLILSIDNALRTLRGESRGTGRPNPGTSHPDRLLRPWERQKSGRMLRVDHAGEVMAQALYTGQAAGSHDPELQATLRQARSEEEDHLRWCAERLRELGSRPSLLGPLWYTSAWGMGFAAARMGKEANLGLVVAVENLVEDHLAGHLHDLPEKDQRSRAILEEMQKDEIGHAEKAEKLGAKELAAPLRLAMGALSKVMTRSALWL